MSHEASKARAGAGEAADGPMGYPNSGNYPPLLQKCWQAFPRYNL